MNEVRELLARHVTLFNQGVRSGDFGPMVAQFTDDAELVFVGIPTGPFQGKAAIAAAYRTQPPDDEIEVLQAREDGDSIRAIYAWQAAPRVPAGTLILTPAGTQIARLVILYGLLDGRPGGSQLSIPR